jgi:hypothetical protein
MMNEYSQELHQKNIRLINPIWDSISKNSVVGWHMSAPSIVRKGNTLEYIQSIINRDNLPYYIQDFDEFINGFFIMINEKADN